MSSDYSVSFYDIYYGLIEILCFRSMTRVGGAKQQLHLRIISI